MSSIHLSATDEFLRFARPAAEKCGPEKTLLLTYNYVQTASTQGFQWVLNVVNRSDFQGAITTTVDGLELLYQPEMAEQLDNSIVDFTGGKIIVSRS